MRKAYQVIANRIGISHTKDDISNYVASGPENLQPSIKIDENAIEILRQYNLKKNSINSNNFYGGIPALAMLTQDKDERKSTAYNNTDFSPIQEIQPIVLL